MSGIASQLAERCERIPQPTQQQCSIVRACLWRNVPTVLAHVQDQATGSKGSKHSFHAASIDKLPVPSYTPPGVPRGTSQGRSPSLLSRSTSHMHRSARHGRGPGAFGTPSPQAQLQNALPPNAPQALKTVTQTIFSKVQHGNLTNLSLPPECK